MFTRIISSPKLSAFVMTIHPQNNNGAEFKTVSPKGLDNSTGIATQLICTRPC